MYRIKVILSTILAFALLSAAPGGIELETKILLDNQITMKIPKHFTIMSRELMEMKYPSEKRPAFVYTDASGSINIALSLTQNKADQKNITAYKDSFVKTFRNLYPTADWKGEGVKDIKGRKVGYLELVTPAIDTDIYNLMFFTDLNGQLLLCTFNCTKENLGEWQATAHEIMNSLKIK